MKYLVEVLNTALDFSRSQHCFWFLKISLEFEAICLVSLFCAVYSCHALPLPTTLLQCTSQIVRPKKATSPCVFSILWFITYIWHAKLLYDYILSITSWLNLPAWKNSHLVIQGNIHNVVFRKFWWTWNINFRTIDTEEYPQLNLVLQQSTLQLQLVWRRMSLDEV